MVDQTSSSSQTGNGKNVPLWVRIVCGTASGAVTPWLLTQCSLHGFDFKTLGFDSETIKGLISGTLTGIAVAPESIPMTIAGIVYSLRLAGRTILRGFTKPLPPEKD